MLLLFSVPALTLSLVSPVVSLQSTSSTQDPQSTQSEAEPSKVFDLDALVITPTRSKESILDVSYTVDFVGEERIDQLRRTLRSTAR